MPIAYNGSHAFVDVPELGRSVKRGEPVKIENSKLRRRLVRQGWRNVPDDDNKGKGDGS